MRVLHCPYVIGGNPPSLARAERELGLDSRAVALVGSPYGYEADSILTSPEDGPLRHESARWGMLLRALRDFDVVHFNFGSSILPMRATMPLGGTTVERLRARAFLLYARILTQRDLPLLKRAGKVIAVTYQGDDARQRDVSLERFEISAATEVGDDYYPPGSDELKRAAIAAFDRHADLIYSLNPDLQWVLPARAQFLPYANVDPRSWRPADEPAPVHRRPVIAHAPTNRAGKGTRHLLAAIDRLRASGLELELRLIEGVTQAEARRMLGGADLLVDQLLVGWYGGVAVEAMALGVPAIAYIRDSDLGVLPDGMRSVLPVISANPDTIEGVLREWLATRRSELPELGARSRTFVERWHDPLAIARRLASDYASARN